MKRTREKENEIERENERPRSRKRNEYNEKGKKEQNISFNICELKKQPENSGNKYTFYNSLVVISCQNEDVKKLGDGREIKK